MPWNLHTPYLISISTVFLKQLGINAHFCIHAYPEVYIVHMWHFQYGFTCSWLLYMSVRYQSNFGSKFSSCRSRGILAPRLFHLSMCVPYLSDKSNNNNQSNPYLSFSTEGVVKYWWLHIFKKAFWKKEVSLKER